MKTKKNAEEPSSARSKNWSDDETMKLISIWREPEVQEKIECTSPRKKLIWDKIAARLHDSGFKARTGTHVYYKIKDLKKKYKKMADMVARSGEEVVDLEAFPWFYEIQTLQMGTHRTAIDPAPPSHPVGESALLDDDEEDEDGSVDLPSNIDTDQSTASPSTARQDTEDNSETSRSAVDLTQQTSDSRKRKRTTPDRLIIDSSVDTSHKDDNLGTNSSGSEPTDDPEYYPKGVVVVQPTAVEDELESAPLAIREEPVVSRNEAAPTSNQRVLFAINRNPKKTPIPILPKITAVHSGYIPTAVNVAHVSQPRHSSTPYDRPQNRQRHTRAPPPPPPPPQQSGGFDPTVLQEQQQQEEHEAKMELFRLQIELATAQLRMAEDEHRIRFAKLQVELQTAQMEHDAKAAQLSTASSS
ncbi:uncharacterized protein [Amphiura filiformis]|uniref:uncharacterized protein isoform X4 n=1 Tax=Amphiura filiformis TaxID=82378 RepID=UPI003B215A23